MARALAGLLSLWASTLCVSAAGAQEFTTLKGHGGPVMDIAVSPEGQVATASFDNAVGLWADRTPEWLEGHGAAVTVLDFGADGTLVSGGDDFTVRLWDDGAARLLGQHAGKVTALDVFGDRVASGSWDGTVRLWPLGKGDPVTLSPPGGGVNAVAFDGAGGLYAATTQGVLMHYDLADGAGYPVVHHGFGINELILGAGWIAYGAVDGGTRVIDAATGQQIADFTLDRRPILSMAWHPASARLAVGDGHGFIMMIDTAHWRITHDFRAARQGPIWALAFSPDGQTIYAGGLDDVAYGWPVDLLSEFAPGIAGDRSFLRAADTMPNGERQFMRKCSICHALTAGPSRKAGPTLHEVFGRPAGSLPGYSYSQTLAESAIVWNDESINALFETGPDHYIPGSKMPMQVITGAQDRADLIAFLKTATKE